MGLSANIQVDDAKDIVTVYGVKVSGELFRKFTEPTREGEWFRIIKRDDDMVTVQSRWDAPIPPLEAATTGERDE